MNLTAYRTINVRGSGRRRLTYWKRITARIPRVNLPFAVVVAFWGVTVAVAGFVAGWVWAQAL